MDNLVLNLSLYTGIDLSAVFKDEDLTGVGIQNDSYITFYKNPNIDISVKYKLETILGETDWKNLIEMFKSQDEQKVLDFFNLGKKEEDTGDFLVLYLQPDTTIHNYLEILHTGLKGVFNNKSDEKYNPYVNLATLNSGKAKDYMFNPTLSLILEKATFSLDDIALFKDNKKYQVTTENAVSRYFRQLHLEQDKEYYDEN